MRNIYACKVNKGNAIVIKCYKIWNSRIFTKIHMIMDFVISLLITKWLIRWFTLQVGRKKWKIMFTLTWVREPKSVTLSNNERYIKKWYGFENKCVNNDFPLKPINWAVEKKSFMFHENKAKLVKLHKFQFYFDESNSKNKLW